MPKPSLAKQSKSLGIRFRAQCEDDSFKGPWRDNRSEAIQDANAHRSVPGNADHHVGVIQEETLFRRLVPKR
jgi:hypothetical protein